MSKKAAKEFYQVLQSNEELQERVSAAENTAIVVQIASEIGYVFTEQELENIMQEAVTNEEIAEQELSSIAGGLMALDHCDGSGSHKYKA